MSLIKKGLALFSLGVTLGDANPNCDIQAHLNNDIKIIENLKNVPPLCCKALQSIETIQFSKLSEVNFNFLCDEYASDNHCWSYLKPNFEENINSGDDNLDLLYRLLQKTCPDSQKAVGIYSDNDFCRMTSRTRVKVASTFCYLREYQKDLSPGEFCTNLNGDYIGACEMYASCGVQEDGSCGKRSDVIEVEVAEPVGEPAPESEPESSSEVSGLTEDQQTALLLSLQETVDLLAANMEDFKKQLGIVKVTIKEMKEE